MRIVSWNIKWGGQDRVPLIAKALRDCSPDVVVLSEYQPDGSAQLLQLLNDAGLCHRHVTHPPNRRGGVAVVSRHHLEAQPIPAALSSFGWRQAVVTVPAINVDVWGLYGPLQEEPYDLFWGSTLDELQAVAHRPVLVTGDFNTCESRLDTPVDGFFCAEFFRQLPARGYTDLWRHLAGREAQEYSWWGPVNPFRLDHAFGTPQVVSRLAKCFYLHAERESKISDHSLLVVDLEP